MSWKAHQLRIVRQDQARIGCLNLLDDAAVLITQDWAMKSFYWFGKRRFSWHLSVVARKLDEKLQSQTLIYIIKNCLQDTSAVVRILEHTLRTLKFKHQEITSAILCQDKVGCYHNSV